MPRPPIDQSHLTFVATQAALRAGEVLRKGFGTRYQITQKPKKHDVVTEYDNAAENCIIDTILQHFPDHSFLAEESGSLIKEKGSPVLWIIDPLDGTVNFAHNIPVFTISIAALLEKEVVSGVIYHPHINELFIAEKGRGAYLNGHKMQTSKTEAFENAFLAAGLPSGFEYFQKISELGNPIRNLGSAALNLAYLAAGRFDVYWGGDLQPWDIAAGKLLVEEAGGKVTHSDGTPLRIFSQKPILATNSFLHKKALKYFNKRAETTAGKK